MNILQTTKPTIDRPHEDLDCETDECQTTDTLRHPESVTFIQEIDTSASFDFTCVSISDVRTILNSFNPKKQLVMIIAPPTS